MGVANCQKSPTRTAGRGQRSLLALSGFWGRVETYPPSTPPGRSCCWGLVLADICLISGDNQGKTSLFLETQAFKDCDQGKGSVAQRGFSADPGHLPTKRCLS